jgi:16S rRNA A1518/A1519 N6-dimethyltransferase RsmA/KsgA/DIM1 with predicted DNA glycosylase/AP lyase activity
MLFLIIIELILLVILILAVVQFFNIVFRGFAPFFTTSAKAIRMVLEAVTINPHDHIYELGAGSARFLQAVEKMYPTTRLTGIEYSPLTYWLAKLNIKAKKSKVKLIRQNLFKTNLKDANLIYCYLIPDMMPKLQEKIMAECQPGTKIISHMFSIPNLEIKKRIEADHEVFYFYEV